MQAAEYQSQNICLMGKKRGIIDDGVGNRLIIKVSCQDIQLASKKGKPQSLPNA